MKKTTYLLLLIFCVAKNISAQNVGIGTNTPGAKAILEIKSNNKGMLPPRLTEDSIIAMGAVTEGMVVYNISRNCLMINNGDGWKCLTSNTSNNTFDLTASSFNTGADSSITSGANAITNLTNGDYCVAGTFSGSKLDLGNGKVLTATPAGATTTHGYVARYSATGNCLWAVKLLAITATTQIVPLAIDNAASGAVFITGKFNDSMALYNANGILFNKLANDVGGDDDIFIIKINGQGGIDWRRREGNGGGADIGSTIKVQFDKVYIGGQFHATQTFGTAVQTTLVTYGGLDGFYVRYDTATGTNCTASLHVGGPNDDNVQDMWVDLNFVYLTGGYETNYIAPVAVAAIGGKDMFVSKYIIGNPAPIWVECARGAGFESGSNIKEQDGNLFVTGVFNSNNTTFTNGAPALQTNGNLDGLVIKINPTTGAFNAGSPSFNWVRQMGGNENDVIYGLDVTTGGTCIVVGNFSNFLRFHNNYSIYATGGTDGFMATYLSQTGDLLKAAKAASIYNDGCRAVTIKNNTEFAIAGQCGQQVTLNGVTTNNANSSDLQAFLWLLK